MTVEWGERGSLVSGSTQGGQGLTPLYNADQNIRLEMSRAVAKGWKEPHEIRLQTAFALRSKDPNLKGAAGLGR